MDAPKVITADEIRKKFYLEGKPISSWADEHGYRRFDVYRVLSGISKAKRGIGHRISVELGLKAGVIV
jgi:gp16 family phage-associated protein